MRRVEGDVVTLRCAKCRSTFHHVVFSGDTDMATDGLGSLAFCSGGGVVVAEMTAEEWNAYDLQSFANRVSKSLGKKVRPVKPLRKGRLLRRNPFLPFLQSYSEPGVIYSCACCDRGEAAAVSKQRLDQFQAAGGRIVVLGDLSIARLVAS